MIRERILYTVAADDQGPRSYRTVIPTCDGHGAQLRSLDPILDLLKRDLRRRNLEP